MRRIKTLLIVIAIVALALFVVRFPTSWLGVAILIQVIVTPIVFLMFVLPGLAWGGLRGGLAAGWTTSAPDPPKSHGLRRGQKVALPDGTRCRVAEVAPQWPLTALEPVPPRVSWEVRVTETCVIQPGGEIVRAKTWHRGPNPCHGGERTGWMLTDVTVGWQC